LLSAFLRVAWPETVSRAKPFGRRRGLDTVSSAMPGRNQADGERMACSNLRLKDVVFVMRSHAALADVRCL
jgi:hypothetical protein